MNDVKAEQHRYLQTRLERRPRTLEALPALLSEAGAVYLRSDGRPFDLAMLALNRARYRLPVVIEINAMAEEQLAYGDDPLRRVHVTPRIPKDGLRGFFWSRRRQADAREAAAVAAPVRAAVVTAR